MNKMLWGATGVFGAGVLLLLAGCMQEPNLTPDFGPEVSSADFSKLVSEIEQPDPYTIKKDEYAYFIRSTNIADQLYQIDKRWAYTVTNKADVGNDYIFTYVRELREYDQNGKEKISQDQDSVSLEKPTAVSPTDMSPLATIGMLVSTKRIHPQTAARTEAGLRPQNTKVTFHNAKLQVTNVAVPDFVRQRSDCGGLSSDKCRGALKAYILSYDQVIWESGEGQRYTVSWTFSPDVPFFGSTMFPNPAGVIQSCSSTMMPYQGSRIKVTQCDEIKDFTFGTE